MLYSNNTYLIDDINYIVNNAYYANGSWYRTNAGIATK